MTELLHELVNQQKLEKIREEKSKSGKERLNQIFMNQTGTTLWSGDMKPSKNVSKVIESILSSKDLEKEYEDMLNTFNVSNVKGLLIVRDDILRKYDNDPYFVRKVTEYTELLAKEIKRATLQQVQDRSTPKVTFYDGK